MFLPTFTLLLQIYFSNGVLKDPGILSAKAKIDPTKALLGCFTMNALPADATTFTANETITDKYCVNYCTYVASGGAKYDFAGLVQYSASSSMCYCFNAMYGAFTQLSKLSYCQAQCRLLGNKDEICQFKNTAQVWGNCLPGFYAPPFCTSRCPDFCKIPVSTGIKGNPCARNRQCAYGCTNSTCFYDYLCKNVTAMDNVQPMPLPLDLVRIPEHLYIFTDLTFAEKTQVKMITYYAKSQGTAYLGIWRYNKIVGGGSMYRMMWKMALTNVDFPGYYTHIFNDSAILIIKPGDVIGVHQSMTAMNKHSSIFRSHVTVFSVFQAMVDIPGFTIEQRSGEYVYGENIWDDGWVPGKTIAEDMLMPRGPNDVPMFLDLRLGVICHCSPNCQRGICNYMSGECKYGCVTGWMGAKCTQMCQTGYYGDGCASTCSIRCANKICDPISGICTNGCLQRSYKGYYCDYLCDAGEYGYNCAQTCSVNCIVTNKPCDIVTGECGGCKPGYQMPDCQNQCNPGTWGNKCNQTCGFCDGGNSYCYSVTGECVKGCIAGYEPPQCFNICRSGLYGKSCKYKCGACINGTVCNIYDGTCAGGCTPGWSDSTCTIPCDFQQYGKDCAFKCNTCFRGCNSTNGVCLGFTPCLIGYQSQLCNNSCPVNKYGPSCMNTCGKCSGINQCRDYDGYCLSGCDNHYKPPFCDCPISTYGFNCSLSCGQCANNDQCDRLGKCPNGCAIGDFEPPYCKNMENVYPNCPKGFWGMSCEIECGNCALKVACDLMGNCPGDCYPGFLPPKCVTPCPYGFWGLHCSGKCAACKDGATCHIVTGHCVLCVDGYKQPMCSDPCNPGFYGYQCVLPCGHCASSAICNATTGVCPAGCDDGYIGFTCQLSLHPETVRPLMRMKEYMVVKQSAPTTMNISFVYFAMQVITLNVLNLLCH